MICECFSTFTFLASFIWKFISHPLCLILSTMDILQLLRSKVVVMCGRCLVGVILHFIYCLLQCSDFKCYDLITPEMGAFIIF